jgi:hypothetical protein
MKTLLRTTLYGAACTSMILMQGTALATSSSTQNQSSPSMSTEPSAPTAITPPQVPAPAVTASSFTAEQLLQNVSRAQLLIRLGDKGAADQHLQQAINQAMSLSNATVEQRSRTNVRTGIVSYLTGRNNNEYFVPLLESSEIVKSYATGPFWSDKKGLAVKDVRAVNVAITIDPKEAQSRLEKARDFLNRDKLEDASEELTKFQRSIAVEEKTVHLPLQQARDNLNLAQFMMQRNFPEGARYALKNADKALDEVKPTTDERKQQVTTMRNEMKQLTDTLAKKDQTITEKALAQIKQWGDELSSWANEKM